LRRIIHIRGLLIGKQREAAAKVVAAGVEVGEDTGVKVGIAAEAEVLAEQAGREVGVLTETATTIAEVRHHLQAPGNTSGVVRRSC